MQACVTTSGYAVSITLTVPTLISSSHFQVHCPLGIREASFFFQLLIEEIELITDLLLCPPQCSEQSLMHTARGHWIK